MKRAISLISAVLLGSSMILGCGEETKTKKETTIETPEGKTKKTDETTIEKSGERPPADPNAPPPTP